MGVDDSHQMRSSKGDLDMAAMGVGIAGLQHQLGVGFLL